MMRRVIATVLVGVFMIGGAFADCPQVYTHVIESKLIELSPEQAKLMEVLVETELVGSVATALIDDAQYEKFMGMDELILVSAPRISFEYPMNGPVVYASKADGKNVKSNKLEDAEAGYKAVNKPVHKGLEQAATIYDARSIDKVLFSYFVKQADEEVLDVKVYMARHMKVEGEENPAMQMDFEAEFRIPFDKHALVFLPEGQLLICSVYKYGDPELDLDIEKLVSDKT